MPKAYIIHRRWISYQRYITRSARNGYHCKKTLLSGRQKSFLHGGAGGIQNPRALAGYLISSKRQYLPHRPSPSLKTAIFPSVLREFEKHLNFCEKFARQMRENLTIITLFRVYLFGEVCYNKIKSFAKFANAFQRRCQSWELKHIKYLNK